MQCEGGLTYQITPIDDRKDHGSNVNSGIAVDVKYSLKKKISLFVVVLNQGQITVRSV